MKDIFPSPDILVELEPEEAAEYLILYLNRLRTDGEKNKFHHYNELHPNNQSLKDYAGTYTSRVSELLNISWFWLLTQGYLAPTSDENASDWVSVTEKGMKVTNFDDIKNLKKLNFLPREHIEPKLLKKIISPFLKGDFDIAVFAAFRQVEIEIREASGLGADLIGVDLARKAFNPNLGPLTDKNADSGERSAQMELFSGPLGAFKNPGSHREVNYDDPFEVVSLILQANTLIRIIEKRGKIKAAEDSQKIKKDQSG